MSGEYKYRPSSEGLPDKRNQNEKIIKGHIVRWNKQKGFGFVHLADGQDVFCHVSKLCEHLKPEKGQEPDFSKAVNVGKIVKNNQGFAAEQVDCDSCAEPVKWELKPKGEAIFGVRELEPVFNKPNSNKESPSPDLVWKANEPFRQALEKQRRWNGHLSVEFFKEFGEPQSVEVFGSGNLTLKYAHGDKMVSLQDALDSEHWKVSPSGLWRQDENVVEVEFVFDDIAGAKVWRPVARLYPQPQLEKKFDLLPQNIQQEVLKIAREKIKSPETVASSKIENFLGNEYSGKRIAEIREDIIALQAPGEAIIHSQKTKHQEEVRESYGDESWGSGRFMDVEGVNYYLTTGIHKGFGTDTRWKSNPKGIKSFRIMPPSAGETVESVRERLLSKMREDLRNQFDAVRQIDPPATDPRLYSLTSEQWMENYNQEWQRLQAEAEKKWQTEDLQKLAEMEKQYEAYEKTLVGIKADINQLLGLLGEYPYFEFRRNYGASKAQTENYTSMLSMALRKLEHRTSGLGADIEPDPEEAKSLLEEVKQEVEALKPGAKLRREEEKKLLSLLIEIEASAELKLDRKRHWEYGIDPDERQSMLDKLKYIKRFLTEPVTTVEEIPDISEIRGLLMEIKYTLDSKIVTTKPAPKEAADIMQNTKPSFTIPENSPFASKLREAMDKKHKKK